MKTSSNRSRGVQTGDAVLGRRRILMIGAAGLVVIGAASVTGRAAGQSLGLDDARDQGLVGERVNGLVGVVRQAPGVDALVARVNEARMVRYGEIAEDTNAPLDAVQARAGRQLIERAQSGWYVESSSGEWVQVP